jgi:S-adenosylmethionine:diacylglycerol 3-amino-3-carboxypropyl transferase
MLPMKENYFLSYILLGHYYDESHLAPYLRRENFETIQKNLDRIEIVTDGCERFFSTLPDSCITKFNFTNIFEWMPPDAYELLLRQTYRVAKDEAVITYRNLLVHRERPLCLANQIESDRDLALSLHERDLSFIYSKYVVERIIKKDKPCTTKFVRGVIDKRGEIFSRSLT